MAINKHERIWRLLSDYQFNFSSQLSEEFICIICKTILKNPHQSPCGCRYCMECILHYLNDKEKHCPGIGDDCKEQPINFNKDLQLDYAINIKISLIKVDCPKPNCKFSDELRNMDNHINSHTEACPYFNIGCHFPAAQTPSIVEHLNFDLYEHGNLLVESLANLKNEITTLKLSITIAKEDSEKKNNQLIEMENKINDLTVSSNGKIEELSESLMKLKTENENLRAALNKSETQIENENEHSENDQIENSATNEEVSRSELIPQTSIVYYSSFKMKIDKFKNKQMYRYKNSNITSYPFYSGYHGYKFCLSVFPNGTGTGFSTHLSVFIHILKGEYDASLCWPMEYPIRICLVDQIFGNIYVDKLFKRQSTIHDQQTMFNRPNDFQNLGIGDEKFISFESLFKNERIYLNDSIVLRCIIR